MRELKPHPDGWRVITAHANGAAPAGRPAVYMVGDSWVDGVAAAASWTASAAVLLGVTETMVAPGADAASAAIGSRGRASGCIGGV